MIPFRTLALASASLLLVSCDDFVEAFHDSDRYREDFHSTHALKPGGHVVLENFNGSVEIIGWEKNSVDILGTKHARDQGILKAMRIDVASTPDSLTIRTVRPDTHRGGGGVRYVLRVPHKVVLERIKTSNGSIRAENLEGSFRLATSNGPARVFRVQGPLDLSTSNGGIEVTDIAGNTILRTSNGPIRADNIRGAFEASTSNAGITARLADPEPDSAIRLKTSNGGIELALDSIKNNSISAGTSNSGITLRLPSTLNAAVRASTSHGSVDSDYAVNMRAGKISKTSIDGTIGSGGPTISLDTSNGNIRIRRN